MGPQQQRIIIVLTGAICAGKSILAKKFQDRYRANIIKTRDLILEALPTTKPERRALQKAGEALDRNDGGAWVKGALDRAMSKIEQKTSDPGIFVLDCARIEGQITAIRQAFGTAVHHVHLTASDEKLKERFEQRRTDIDEPRSYAIVRNSRTEKNIEKLAASADIVVVTDRCSEDDVLVRACALLKLYPRSITPLVDVLVGGQYGSEGKGNIAGHIAPEYDLLVRVGGPNAGHKVFGTPVQVYHHLPSGTQRAPDAQLLLGAGAVIYVPKLRQEIADHLVSAERLSIDPLAMIIEDADRVLEQTLLETISSTAQGVGSATARKIMGRGGKLESAVRLAKDVDELKPYIREAQPLLEKAYLRGSRILLEGTQGTTLSIHHGPYPHVTSRDTSVAGCLADAGIAPTRVRRVVMVCRTFPIRVADPASGQGTSGEMNMPITYEELSMRSGIPIDELKKTEKTTTTQKQRRLAEFDWTQLRRSAQLNGPTDIALTFADYLSIENRKAYRFDQLTSDTLRFIEEIERVAGVPVNLISTSFNWRNVIDRRSW